MVDPEPEYEIVGTSHGLYAYETLSDEEKVVYDEITYAIENRLEGITVSTVDEDLLDKAHWAVYYDHGEYFWTETYQYEIYRNFKDEIVKLVFMPVYTMDQEQQDTYQAQIDQVVDEILSQAPVDGTDYDKAMYVYKTLIETTDYNLEAENNQNIISIFLNNETVCLGYSYGAQYLLEQLDIPCTTVYGVADGQTHAWNLIQMDGDYYYMDVTWGEVSYWEEMDDVPPEEIPEESETGDDVDSTNDTGSMDDQSDENSAGADDLHDKSEKYVLSTINYSFFGVSDADTDFMESHQAYDYVPMPACTATENNYYVHEGLYFTGWDKEEVGGKIREAYENGESQVFLKFAHEGLYATAFDYLIEKGNWYRYCDQKQIIYVDQFEENVLMFEFITE